MTVAATTSPRVELTERIKQMAELALTDPTQEATARMMILGHFLDPAARVINQAISRLERGNHQNLPTVHRDLISDYITRAMERQILGFSDRPLDLAELMRASSPFSWGDRFAASCVQSGITEVRRARARESGVDLGELSNVVSLASVTSRGALGGVLSAEESYLIREREQLVHSITDRMDNWKVRGLTAHDRMLEQAADVRSLVGVPPASIIPTERRWFNRMLRAPGAAETVRQSLIAHRDLVSGDPRWEQLSLDDRLLDLWVDYTADQATSLLNASPQAAALIASEVGLLPPRPREPRRIEVRRMAKSLSRSRGWPGLVMRLERSWAAEFFDARCDVNGYDKRTDRKAETDRAKDAAGWSMAATESLGFSGTPFGPSVRNVSDVASWLHRAHQVAIHSSLASVA